MQEQYVSENWKGICELSLEEHLISSVHTPKSLKKASLYSDYRHILKQQKVTKQIEIFLSKKWK